MKHIIIPIFFIISFSSFSQNWKLNNIDKTKEYGFQYTFSFQNENDNNKFKFITKENSKRTGLSGQIFDKLNNPISGASIKIISEDSTLCKELHADFDGNFKMELPIGEYSIEINYFGFDKLISDFEVDEKSKLKMNIILGRGPELLVYQINSKTELNENKIKEIINCIEKKRNKRRFSTTECSKNEQYRVVMQM